MTQLDLPFTLRTVRDDEFRVIVEVVEARGAG